MTNGGAAALRPVSMVAGGGALSGTAAANRPTSLMDRMSKLNQAQQQWQNKVEEKVNFFVFNKLKYINMYIYKNDSVHRIGSGSQTFFFVKVCFGAYFRSD